MTSLKQLTNRRKSRGIKQTDIADKMRCSVQWVRWLENANTTRPTADLWRGRYEIALRETIAEQDELIKAGGKRAAKTG
jgi:transcriptional regulator with XRE-family HTH domain